MVAVAFVPVVWAQEVVAQEDEAAFAVLYRILVAVIVPWTMRCTRLFSCACFSVRPSSNSRCLKKYQCRPINSLHLLKL
jgi:hypothetical protein